MNYDQIVNLALSYTDRTDIDITERMSDFVSIVEARINRALRVNQMSTRSVILTQEDRRYYGLPVGFAGIRDIEVRDNINESGETAIYLNPEQMNNEESLDDGKIYYTIIANQIQLFPTQPEDRVLEIVYYKMLDQLTALAPVNWLSLRFPDCYVFGLIVEIEAFVKNPAGAELWNQRFEAALAELEFADQIDRWSGTPLTVKVG